MIRSIMCNRMNDIYMQMLLHLNEDFDDDLLSDILDILDWLSEWLYYEFFNILAFISVLLYYFWKEK